MKITFIGAGSTVFAKNVLGDCMLAEGLPKFEIALLDIDEQRLSESYSLICALRDKYKPSVTVNKYLADSAEEELFFRGIVYPFIKNKMDGKKNKIILSVIISSSIFSLFHLFNLFSGEVGYTLLQVFYTFFLGCMLSTVYESEDNIFICATLHATFNFCGNVVRVAGSGEYFSVQLILTVLLVAVLAGIITLTKLLKLNKTPNEE